MIEGPHVGWVCNDSRVSLRLTVFLEPMGPWVHNNGLVMHDPRVVTGPWDHALLRPVDRFSQWPKHAAWTKRISDGH